MDINEAVATAVKEHADFHNDSGSTIDHDRRPRVIVKCAYAKYYALRKPFRKTGRDGITAWVVQWHGFPRLSNPRRGENGFIIFDANYG